MQLLVSWTNGWETMFTGTAVPVLNLGSSLSFSFSSFSATMTAYMGNTGMGRGQRRIIAVLQLHEATFVCGGLRMLMLTAIRRLILPS